MLAVKSRASAEKLTPRTSRRNVWRVSSGAAGQALVDLTGEADDQDRIEGGAVEEQADRHDPRIPQGEPGAQSHSAFSLVPVARGVTTRPALSLLGRSWGLPSGLRPPCLPPNGRPSPSSVAPRRTRSSPEAPWLHPGRVERGPRGCWTLRCTARGLRRLPQYVAHTAHGVQQPLLATCLSLLTQITDIDLDNVAFTAEVVAPYPVEDHLARQHLARMSHEEIEQLVLLV